MPFSDPLADGPVIQRATERALAAGGSLRASLDADRRGPRATCRRRSSSSATRTRCCAWGSTRSRGARPRRRRRRRARARSADRGGGRVPRRAGARAGIDTIFLLSPTTTDARIRKAAALGQRLPVRHLAARRHRRARRAWPSGARGAGRADPRARRRCRSRSGSASRGPSTWPRSAGAPTRPSSAARSCR